MRKFSLNGGTHSEGTAENFKIFSRGDVVESDEDLVKKFGDKFEEIIPEKPESKSVVKPVPKIKTT